MVFSLLFTLWHCHERACDTVVLFAWFANRHLLITHKHFFGLFFLAYDLADDWEPGDCAFAGFCSAKDEILPVPSFEIGASSVESDGEGVISA